MVTISTIVVETFKALYTAFIKKTVEDVFLPKLKSLFTKSDKTSIEDCFNKALKQVMTKYNISDEELLRSKLNSELYGNRDILTTFPNVKQGITSDFYDCYTNEINKHADLKQKIDNSRQLLADDVLVQVDRNFESLVADVSLIKKDLQELVLNQGLGADVKIVEAGHPIYNYDKHIIVRDDVGEVAKLLSIGKILNLYGGHLLGKDVLASQAAETYKDKTVIHINLHYKKDINVIELIRQCDAPNQIIIVSNLDYRFGDEYCDRIVSTILGSNCKSIIIITTLEPIKELLSGESTKGILLYEVKDFSPSDMEQLALTYGMPSNFPLKKLVFYGYQHPIVANACCALCQKDGWRGSKVLADLLFRVQDFDISRKLSLLIKHFVSEDATRNLMARINLLHLNTLPMKLVESLANVAPGINGYMEKINELMPDWIVQDNDNIKISSLLRYWHYGLMTEEKKSCYIAAAQYFLSKKTLDPMEIGWIITFFADAGEYDKAGYMYSSALEKIKPLIPELKEPPLFTYFWIDLPLPEAMSAPVKIIVRLSQLTSPLTKDEYKEYLVKDLFEIQDDGMVSDDLKDLTYKLIGFYAASKGDMWLSQKCIDMDAELAFKPLQLPKELKDEQDELNDKFRQISVYLLVKSKNIDEFKVNLSRGKFDISLQLAYSFACYVINRLISSDEDPVHWDALLHSFNQYVEAAKGSINANLFCAFKTMQLLIEGKDLRDAQLMEKDFQEAIKDVSDGIALGMFHYALGYSYYALEKETDSQKHLIEALKVIDKLPAALSKKIYLLLSYIAAHNGNHEQQIHYIESIDNITDVDSIEVEKAQLIGEKAIAYWDSGNIDKSIRLIGKALILSVNLIRQDKDNYLNKNLLSKVGCCVSQWYYMCLHGHFEDDKVYPIPGMFTEHYEDAWTEGDFDMKEFGILLQMYHLESITIDVNTALWAKELMKSSNLHPNNLHQVLTILTIPMIVNRQYSDLSELLDIDIRSISLPSKEGMPKFDPTGRFFNYFVIPLLMENVIDGQESQPMDLLGEVIMPIIRKAQKAEGYCESDILGRTEDILNGKQIDKDEDNIWVRATEFLMNLAGTCSAPDAFLYTFNILEQTEPLYERLVWSDKLMSQFAYSVLNKQMNIHADELDIKGINERGEKYINSKSDTKQYKRIMNVFYCALKNFHVETSLENRIMDWLEI